METIHAVRKREREREKALRFSWCAAHAWKKARNYRRKFGLGGAEPNEAETEARFGHVSPRLGGPVGEGMAGT